MSSNGNGVGNKAVGWISMIIVLIIGIILIPIVVDQVTGTNTTSWNFTGGAGAITLFNLLPFVFIVGLLIYFIMTMLGKI